MVKSQQKRIELVTADLALAAEAKAKAEEEKAAAAMGMAGNAAEMEVDMDVLDGMDEELPDDLFSMDLFKGIMDVPDVPPGIHAFWF